MGKRIVGIQKIMKKDGSGFGWRLHYQEDYSDYEKNNSECQGVRCGSEYVSRVDCSGVKVGDEVKFFMEQFGRVLVVTEVQVVNAGK